MGIVPMSPASAVDTTSPTVTINQAAGQADPTSTSPVVYTVEFSESISGFTGSDVDLSLSTAGGSLTAAVSGGPAVYNVSVSGMTTSGLIIAVVPAAVAVDPAANPNTASTSTDNTVTWTQASQPAGSPSPTSTGGGLPVTGVDVPWLVALGLVLIATGTIALAAIRRRSSGASQRS